MELINTKYALICFLALFSGIAGFAQTDVSVVNLKTKKIVESFFEKENIPGMSVTISINDTVIFSEGFGFADVENKITVDPSKTKFRMASITKTMTAATLARLSELGEIDLKKSPYFYLDSLPKKQFDFTIEQIGGHLSGIKRTASTEKYSCDNTYDRKDFFKIFGEDDLLFEPATNMSYSNYGYKLLGVLVEKITGKTITENHRKYIIDAIGMKNTVPESKSETALVSKFYMLDKKQLNEAACLDCTFKYAAGCYLSTSEDLVKLGNAYLYPNRILQKESLVELIKSKKLKSGLKTNYGFGFTNASDSYGNLYYGHEGGYDSARSCLRIYPKYKIVIAVLLNCRVDNIDVLVSKIGNNYIKD